MLILKDCSNDDSYIDQDDTNIHYNDSNDDKVDTLVQGDATYTLDGKVLGIFPVYGEGPMYLEVSTQISKHFL